MNVLVACEFSGIVRDAFRELGHEAISCDMRHVTPRLAAPAPLCTSCQLRLWDDVA